MMTSKTYYIENSIALTNALAMISLRYPSAISRTYIEMDYSEVSITARTVNFASIERILAPLM